MRTGEFQLLDLPPTRDTRTLQTKKVLQPE